MRYFASKFLSRLAGVLLLISFSLASSASPNLNKKPLGKVASEIEDDGIPGGFWANTTTNTTTNTTNSEPMASKELSIAASLRKIETRIAMGFIVGGALSISVVHILIDAYLPTSEMVKNYANISENIKELNDLNVTDSNLDEVREKLLQDSSLINEKVMSDHSVKDKRKQKYIERSIQLENSVDLIYVDTIINLKHNEHTLESLEQRAVLLAEALDKSNNFAELVAISRVSKMAKSDDQLELRRLIRQAEKSQNVGWRRGFHELFPDAIEALGSYVLRYEKLESKYQQIRETSIEKYSRLVLADDYVGIETAKKISALRLQSQAVDKEIAIIHKAQERLDRIALESKKEVVSAGEVSKMIETELEAVRMFYGAATLKEHLDALDPLNENSMVLESERYRKASNRLNELVSLVEEQVEFEDSLKLALEMLQSGLQYALHLERHAIEAEINEIIQTLKSEQSKLSTYRQAVFEAERLKLDAMNARDLARIDWDFHFDSASSLLNNNNLSPLRERKIEIENRMEQIQSNALERTLIQYKEAIKRAEASLNDLMALG